MKKLNKRDFFAGLAVFVFLAGAIYFVRLPKTSVVTNNVSTPTQTPKGRVEGLFDIQIPEDVEKADLKDVTGGDASGLATRKFLPAQAGKDGKFSHMVLADLVNPPAGEFYQGWLIRGKQGESNFDFISTGKLREAKGGWLLDFEQSKDYSEYNQVVVTLEKFFDKTLEKHILEGSF
ncbi:hypothetical protein A3D00_04605 [Candidatus Woesebacteria bacterium RIFCSPHIGHO2_02_FULL_38_9]|nr:MAG: hypothetical protein A3D00_04605 [Candidatus Woesebacteria bacterium RIFCSPHIGHO2_02_FULL_38_9]OGM56722.1 MAG: hypothetical protein A3A50_05195 [Candidatus Woesebacteria bacterium RIFCSPLOWO2_01_FULL_38_20]